jgi:hypothetical protein
LREKSLRARIVDSRGAACFAPVHRSRNFIARSP